MPRKADTPNTQSMKRNILLDLKNKNILALKYASKLGKTYPTNDINVTEGPADINVTKDNTYISKSVNLNENYYEYNIFSIQTQILNTLKSLGLNYYPRFNSYEIRGKNHVIVTFTDGINKVNLDENTLDKIRKLLSNIDDTLLLVISSNYYRELRVPEWWLYQILQYMVKYPYTYVKGSKYYIKLQSNNDRELMWDFKINVPANNGYMETYNDLHKVIVNDIDFLFKSGSIVCDVVTDISLINDWQLTSWNDSPVYICDWVDTRFETNKTRFLYERRYKKIVTFYLGDNRVHRHVVALKLNKKEVYFYFFRNIVCIECNNYKTAIEYGDMVDQVKATISGELDYYVNVDFPINTTEDDLDVTCYECYDVGNGPWILSKVRSLVNNDVPQIETMSKYITYDTSTKNAIRLYNGIIRLNEPVLSKDYATHLRIHIVADINYEQASNILNFIEWYIYDKYKCQVITNHRITELYSEELRKYILEIISYPLFRMDDGITEPVMVSIYEDKIIHNINFLDFKDVVLVDPCIAVVTDNYTIVNKYICVNKVNPDNIKRSLIVSNDYSNFCESSNSTYDSKDIMDTCKKFKLHMLSTKAYSTCVYYRRDPNIDIGRLLNDNAFGIPYMYFIVNKNYDFSDYIINLDKKYTQEYVNKNEIRDIAASMKEDKDMLSLFPGGLIGIPVRSKEDIDFFYSHVK